MKIVTLTTRDVNGYEWSKDGDFGVIAVGTNPADVEVDFTATSGEQIKFLVATIMTIAHKEFPDEVREAIEMYKKQVGI